MLMVTLVRMMTIKQKPQKTSQNGTPRIEKLLAYEQKLWAQGHKFVAGVDEAGRGPLAGPLVVAAVVLNSAEIQAVLTQLDKSRNNDVKVDIGDTELGELINYTFVNDSKKISANKRTVLASFIKKRALCYTIEVVDREVIDTKGISHATQVGFFNSFARLKLANGGKAHHVLTDNFAIKALRPELQTNIVRGDALSLSIAAASILAKVHRDSIMCDLHKVYPVYGFDRHKGYGTKAHFLALQEHGPCAVHRMSFSPIRESSAKQA